MFADDVEACFKSTTLFIFYLKQLQKEVYHQQTLHFILLQRVYKRNISKQDEKPNDQGRHGIFLVISAFP